MEAGVQTQAPLGGVAAAEGLAAWLGQRGLPADKSNAVAARGADGLLHLVTARPVARYGHTPLNMPAAFRTLLS